MLTILAHLGYIMGTLTIGALIGYLAYPRLQRQSVRESIQPDQE